MFVELSIIQYALPFYFVVLMGEKNNKYTETYCARVVKTTFIFEIRIQFVFCISHVQPLNGYSKNDIFA